ncbi:MAG: nucleotide exchange factor GrpE [Bacteroidota bacterium]
MDDPRTPGEGQAANSGAGALPGDTLQARLDEALQAAEIARDQFLRKAAEFENYKRRTEAEFAAAIRTAHEGLLRALLPVVDDLGRSLKAGAEGGDPRGFFQGIQLIQAKLMKILEGHGLVPYASEGKPFDVEYHDALLQIPRPDLPPHTVIEEVEPGYMLSERVLRHAKVIVSAPASEPPPSGEENPAP